MCHADVNTNAKVTATDFDVIKAQFVFDIWRIVDMEDSPLGMIINWDDTGSIMFQLVTGRWLKKDPKELR